MYHSILFAILLLINNKLENKDCLTLNSFNIVVNYIKKNGTKMKLSERLVSDKNTYSLEVKLNSKHIELEDCENFKKIIIINENIPSYFISNKNNIIKISSHESRVDTEKDIKTRKKDWCYVVKKIMEFSK